ncbi:RNA ligase family protein [Burkholderia ambifaria]|uniref:RNA ligase family protein n=1 Tax=Burkholderia ambifaria TaxID=152480 RepID=UPI000F7FB41E|nr:RNA ligase family protein [Burkholderia ambifaria]
MGRQKYPRTPHMPFSPGATLDDKTLRSLAHFRGEEVVITLKRDGENTSLYRDGFHAKSINSRHHPSRDWLAGWHARFAHEIPDGWRICGENLYARHSLAYTDLPSYFMGFSVWDETNTALAWDDTLEVFALLDIVPVPEVWRGLFDEAVLHRLVRELDTTQEEGLVMRRAGRIRFEDFGRAYAKWVRADHVQTDEHWMHASIVPNGLRAREG